MKVHRHFSPRAAVAGPSTRSRAGTTSHTSRSTARTGLASLNLRLDHLTQDLDEVAGAINSSSSAEAGRSLGVRRKTIQRKPERPEMNAVHGRPVNKRVPATAPLVPPPKRRRMTLAPIVPSRTSSREDALDDELPEAAESPSLLLDRRFSPESGRIRTIAREANDLPPAVQTSQGLLRLPSFMRPHEVPAAFPASKSPTPPWLTEYVQSSAEPDSAASHSLAARRRSPSSTSSRITTSHEYTEHVAPLRKLPSIDQVPVTASAAGWPVRRRTPLPFSTSGRRQTLSPMSTTFLPLRPSNIYQAQLVKPMHLFDAIDYGHLPDGGWHLPLSPSYSSLSCDSRTELGVGPFQTASARQAMLLPPPQNPGHEVRQLDYGSLSRHGTFEHTKSLSPGPQPSFQQGFATPPRLTSAFGWHEPLRPPSPPVPFAPTSDDSFPQADLSEVPRFWRRAPQLGLPSQPQSQPGRARYAALLEREAASQVVHPAPAESADRAALHDHRESRSAFIHSTSSLPPSPRPDDAPQTLRDESATTGVDKQIEPAVSAPTPGVDPQLLGGLAPPQADDSQATDLGASYEDSQQSTRAAGPVSEQEKPTWDLLGSAEDLRLALLSEEDAQKEVDANGMAGEGGFAIYQDSLEEDPIEEA
ncbi:hypothetical protein NBRC10512_000830 [Rhodotorula toruloides]|uniref:RHTO0S06e07910g1_1 n=2 Tax=Rhodotorula toruloides TaxID=5286 RepID=A0A061AW94_RHOTO|nr:uncharacterized protein RHTO_06337 [Rhodotorula toruloides NP11]EMS24333.1 hypothetical protein RHTO_06337 [Rhodotorula toruloides NP11]CDR41929.1 RHTO0S06e07910g1_1 [Rhodotorula toruloides]